MKRTDEPPVIAVDFCSREPRVDIIRAGYTEEWRWGEVIQGDGTQAWTITTRLNEHGNDSGATGVSEHDASAAGANGVRGEPSGGLRPGEAPGAPGGGASAGEAGKGADSRAAFFDSLLGALNLLSFGNPLAGYQFPEPPATFRDRAALRVPDRMTAYRTLLRQMMEAPAAPPPLTPMRHEGEAPDGCPCLSCSVERAFAAAHDGDFAAELEKHGSAILFIELGGKPKP